MTEDQQRQKNRDKQARYRASPSNTIKLRYMKARYGLTPEQYEAMVKDQDNLCAICKLPPRGRWGRLHVDHCHKTGVVRGLLCFRCNAMLGHAEDNPIVLQAVIDYLR
jgi:hypothetical protein